MSRPRAENGPSQHTAALQRPAIPSSAVSTLIPRLTTTINDIDSFSLLLLHGQADGSLPSWDTLLQRYSLLLGKINSLSTYLAQPPPPPALRAGQPPPSQSTRPALERFLVHPLNPLSDPSLPSSSDNANEGAQAQAQAAPIDPIAADTFFQVLNTQLLPAVSAAQDGALQQTRASGSHVAAAARASAGTVSGHGQARAGQGEGSGSGSSSSIPGWMSRDDLKRAQASQGEAPVRLLRQKVDERLRRESAAARSLREVIRAKEDEVEWEMRVVAEDEEGEEGAGAGAGAGDKAVGDDDDDDLFGDGDDDGAGEEGKPPATTSAPNPPLPPPAPNPREGWTVADYIRYMDTGAIPAPAPAASLAVT